MLVCEGNKDSSSCDVDQNVDEVVWVLGLMGIVFVVMVMMDVAFSWWQTAVDLLVMKMVSVVGERGSLQ